MEGTTAKAGRTGLQTVLAVLLSVMLAVGFMPAAAHADETEGGSEATVTLEEFKAAVSQWEARNDAIKESSDGEGLEIGDLYANATLKGEIAAVIADANAAIESADETTDLTSTYNTLSAEIENLFDMVSTKSATVTADDATEAINDLKEYIEGATVSETGSELEVGTQFVTPTVMESMQEWLESAQAAFDEGGYDAAYTDANKGSGVYLNNVQIRTPTWDELNDYVNAVTYFYNSIYPEADEDKASAGDVIVPNASYDALEDAIDAALAVLDSSDPTGAAMLEAWTNLEDAMDSIHQNYKTKSSPAVAVSDEGAESTTTETTTSNSPKTGDNSMALAGLLALAGVAAATSGTLAVRRMKSNKE